MRLEGKTAAHGHRSILRMLQPWFGCIGSRRYYKAWSAKLCQFIQIQVGCTYFDRPPWKMLWLLYRLYMVGMKFASGLCLGALHVSWNPDTPCETTLLFCRLHGWGCHGRILPSTAGATLGSFFLFADVHFSASSDCGYSICVLGTGLLSNFVSFRCSL